MPEKTPVKASNSTAPARPAAAAEALPALPGMQWRNLAVIGGVVVVFWLTALAIGRPWAFIAAGAVTVAVIVLMLWVLRWATKQRELMTILQNANASPEARKEALAKLAAKDGADKDVMNAIARAQLEAQEDPDKALATLEAIDIKKVPGPMADDVRAFRAQLYLLNGRANEARELADEIKVSNAQQADSRGMLAATVAEAWARTGKYKDALELLGTIKPEDPAYEKAKVPLLFARIYAAFAGGQREMVKRDLNALIRQDMNLLARFVMPRAKVHPELQKMARDALQKNPEVRKMAQKQARVVRRR